MEWRRGQDEIKDEALSLYLSAVAEAKERDGGGKMATRGVGQDSAIRRCSLASSSSSSRRRLSSA